jgi:hypothetical protein
MQYNRVQHDPKHGQFSTTRGTGVTKHKRYATKQRVSMKIIGRSKSHTAQIDDSLKIAGCLKYTNVSINNTRLLCY